MKFFDNTEIDHFQKYNSKITLKKGIEFGIFFRNPIQRVDYDINIMCDEKNYSLSAWNYINKIKNPIRKLYEILIGNGKIITNIKDWSQDDDWIGFTANKLCFPIYFKRRYRKLLAISTDKTRNVQIIESYGYESEFNIIDGECYIEKTIVTLKSKRKHKIIKHDKYYYTYPWEAIKVFKTGGI